MKIAIAKDEAFNFMYRANVDAMKECGDVCFFSPLTDPELPVCDLLYLPGGYPELFAEALAQNTSMKESIRQYAEKNGAIFAECGGMMYLTQSIEINGEAYPMCDILPFKSTMKNAHLHLGYRIIPLDKNSLKGHEFHYSEIEESVQAPAVQATQNQLSAKGLPVPTTIYHYKNVIAGYTHWYWAECGFETFLKQLKSCIKHA